MDLLVRAAEKSDQSSPKHFVLHRQKTDTARNSFTVTMERELWHRLLLIQPSIHLVRELGEIPGSYIDNGIMSNRVPCYIALAALLLVEACKLQLFKIGSYVGTACKPVLGTLNQKARTSRFWML